MRHWFLEGGTKIGTVITLENPAIAELARIAGFDWAWIDGEHGSFDERGAATAAAVLSPATKSFVRVPDKTPTTLKRFLDAGCDGIIVPHVNSRADCDGILRASLFPPHGQRSVGIARAQGYGAYFSESIRTRSYALIIQIETAEGVRNVQEIVAMHEIDAVLIGPYDLSGSLGVLGEVDAPLVTAAIGKVLASCKAAGMPCGIFAGDAQRASGYVAQGFDFVGAGVDTALLLNAYSTLIKQARP
jgi:2-keto-3-deoxy-L-rhamnonate aldolase RhmA